MARVELRRASEDHVIVTLQFDLADDRGEGEDSLVNQLLNESINVALEDLTFDDADVIIVDLPEKHFDGGVHNYITGEHQQAPLEFFTEAPRGAAAPPQGGAAQAVKKEWWEDRPQQGAERDAAFNW